MSQRLPAVSAKDTLRALVKAGFETRRTSGSHCRLVHKTDLARSVTIPMHVAT